jgi:hypothetical protein
MIKMVNQVINPALQREIVQALVEKISANYIFPDVAERICRCLEQHLEAGDYADINEGAFFVYALTQHIQEINQDEHLWVKWHPEPLPDEGEALRLSQAWVDEQKQAARLENYGFHQVERLPGNVGYLDIRFFHRPAWGGDTAVAAMNFMADTSALIIDLRQCPGGYPGMTQLISSYLFGDDPVHLNSIYWRDEDFTQQYWTLPYVPGQRYGEKPVYVLISKETFSGGEGFAYELQALGRATILGEQTDGGAHPGASYRLHPHFEAFIPVGRAINPVTKDNWESSGVKPDVLIDPELAQDQAYKMALEDVIESLGDPPPGSSQRLLKEAQAALDSLARP